VCFSPIDHSPCHDKVRLFMKTRTLIGLTMILLGLLVYCWSTRDRLHVEPHAAREIEKAKRR
jgi:hypothetical protein